MGVRVVNLKGDGNAWVQVYDQRLPTGRARIYVGNDWRKAESVPRAIQRKADPDPPKMLGDFVRNSIFVRGATL